MCSVMYLRVLATVPASNSVLVSREAYEQSSRENERRDGCGLLFFRNQSKINVIPRLLKV